MFPFKLSLGTSLNLYSLNLARLFVESMSSSKLVPADCNVFLPVYSVGIPSLLLEFEFYLRYVLYVLGLLKRFAYCSKSTLYMVEIRPEIWGSRIRPEIYLNTGGGALNGVLFMLDLLVKIDLFK
jgi:hypothetical protein